MAKYTPTNWKDGDTITAERLNKIEAQLVSSQNAINEANTTATNAQSTAQQATTDAATANQTANLAMDAVVDAFARNQAITEAVGNLSSLTTTDKTSIVAAINEVNGKPSGTVAGVTSFNGRLGAVMPQSGDYTADLITFDGGETLEQKLASGDLKGNPGDNGLDAITIDTIVTAGEGEVAPNWEFTYTNTHYNRTPILGDILTVSIDETNGDSYTGVAAAVQISDYATTWKLLSCMVTTGAQGEPGTTVASGVSYDGGTHTNATNVQTALDYLFESGMGGGNGDIVPNGLVYNSPLLWLARDGVTIGNPVTIIGSTPLQVIPTPTQDGTLTYNGQEQTPVWDGYNSEQMTISGTTSATNAGTYSATFTLEEGFCWNPDGDTSPQTVFWVIGKQTITQIPSQSGTLTYTGETLTPEWDNYSDSQLIIGGTTSAIDAGIYSATFTPDGNHRWDNGNTGAKTVNWTIDKQTITTVPSQSGSLTYTGETLTPTWDGYDSNKMILAGTTSAISAGDYEASFTLKPNFVWGDGSTATKNVSWTIGKAAGSLTLSKTSVTLNASTLTDTVAVTRAGNGAVTATSSDTNVAAVSVSDPTGSNPVVTISHVNQTSGTATVTISVAASTNYNAPANKTVSVTAQFLPVQKALNDCTWAEIREISDAGKGSEYWSVGDRKGVLVNGTVGTLSINQTLYVYILGFNHNASVEGSGIHFGTFKSALTGGTDVCLVDSAYSTSNSSGAKNFNFNHWGSSSSPFNTNYGGWKGCDARYDILGSTKTAPSGYGSTPTTSRVGHDAPTDTATNPVANTLMAALPSDLRAVMKPITKYTDSVGNSSNVAGNVTASVDYLPLLAEFEIFGAHTYANQYEQNSQLQYDYYKAGNSKVKYRHSATSSTAVYWERSPRYSAADYFCAVDTDGGASYGYSRTSRGLAPAFMV